MSDCIGQLHRSGTVSFIRHTCSQLKTLNSEHNETYSNVKQKWRSIDSSTILNYLGGGTIVLHRYLYQLSFGERQQSSFLWGRWQARRDTKTFETVACGAQRSAWLGITLHRARARSAMHIVSRCAADHFCESTTSIIARSGSGDAPHNALR